MTEKKEPVKKVSPRRRARECAVQALYSWALSGNVDFSMSHYLDRTLDELDPIEKSILRLAVYELQFEPDVPYKVAINEAIEVAKVFGADESHKYINGVLDKVAPALGRK